MVRALLIGAIPMLSWLGVLQVWQIYVLALLAGALSPATGAGVRVILPHLVADDELERANALASISLQLTWLLGPALAGMVITRVGGAFALVIDAVSFLLMGLLVLSLPSISRPHFNEVSLVKTSWLGGFVVIFRKKEIRLLTSLSVLFFFSYGPLEAALPLYSDRVLHAGAQGYGLLWTGFGARLALTTAAVPLGALMGGFLLQYLPPALVIGLSGIACILAGGGGLVSPTMRDLGAKETLDQVRKREESSSCSWFSYPP